MAASGSGDSGSGFLVKICVVICILTLLYLCAWAGYRNKDNGPIPDVPDRDPCTVRCDRTGLGVGD